MRRSRVVWSSSADQDSLLRSYPPARAARPVRAAALRRVFRTGVLLALLGLARLAGNPRWRTAVIGAALTIPGLVLRGSMAGDVLLLPGLMTLFYAPFLPGDSRENRVRQARLRRELAAYSSPAQRRDLEAILDRYPDGETSELRAILASQAMARVHLKNPGMRPY
jgi:hypothetical protein